MVVKAKESRRKDGDYGNVMVITLMVMMVVMKMVVMVMVDYYFHGDDGRHEDGGCTCKVADFHEDDCYGICVNILMVVLIAMVVMRP